jgi:hypothetical protein
MLAHALRHLALRLWLTVLIGGLGSLALVPLIQALMGLSWVALPVILFLTLIFLGLGWVSNAWAGLLIERLRNEGAVWERAGMRREAAQRYEALMGMADSFLLSPGRRRQTLAGLLPKLTRFYLDQERGGPVLDRLLRAHLEAHPDDVEVAARWLRLLQLNREDPPPWAHDLAQQLGETLGDADEVVALLVGFYLANGRSDHAALSLYRRHWQANPAFRKAKAVRLAQLLSMEAHRGRWALDVYLTAWTQGAPKSQLRPVIERCLAAIPPTAKSGPLVARARQLLGGERSPVEPPPAADSRVARQPATAGEATTASPRVVMGGPEADFEEEAAFIYRRRRTRPRRAPGAGMARFWRDMGSRLLSLGPWMGALGARLLRGILRPWGKVLGLGLLAAALILLITNTVEHLRPGSPPPPAQPEPTAPPAVSDPFTIQVAAYLKAEDAKAYAGQLKAKGLDAYWTEAVGAKRNWYQVRIDHFATKDAARKLGEELKAKGLINDFYVANYRPPQPPEKP